MCNEHVLRDEAQSRRRLQLSRRDFDLLAFSAAAIALLPSGVRAATPLQETRVDVTTPDGVADAFFVHPAQGRHPGVLLWPDFMSLRPAYEQMARRLAESGYSVLVPNLYYRARKAPVVDKVDFRDKVAMEMLTQFARQLTPAAVEADARAFIGFLDGRASVDRQRRIGTHGYCMGGTFAFRAAAAVPERVGALASFHASELAADEPGSPVRLVPQLKARALVGISEDDDQRDPNEKTALREAFSRAGLPAEIEVYAGARHGWCTPDMTALYHEAQAARAWSRLLALYQSALQA